VLTESLDDEAKTHRGSTSATEIATLAATNILKERRRRRFVAVGGFELRKDAYKGIVHDDEKTNAVEAIEHSNQKPHWYEDAGAVLN
jgi:hypothetical protein